jgi:hypothetical protein
MEEERQAAVDRAEEWMTGRGPPREYTFQTSGNVLYAPGMRVVVDGVHCIVKDATVNGLTIIEALEE